MKIGEAAERSGVSAKRIRYYEEIGLLRPASRMENGYRDYDERAVHELRFARRAREFGFSIEQVQELLDLWRDPTRSSASVKALAEAHLADIGARIRRLEEMRDTLKHLVQNCRGDDRPGCPIIESLENEGREAASHE